MTHLILNAFTGYFTLKIKIAPKTRQYRTLFETLVKSDVKNILKISHKHSGHLYYIFILFMFTQG